MDQLRKDIQTWVGNNLKVKVNTELKTDSTEEYKVLSDNNFTDEDKSKLEGIAEGAGVNVQSDWNATSGDAFIKNKPAIPSLEGYATETWVNSQGFKTTDNSTTESGHYTPTTEDVNKKQSAGSGKYISAVKLDSKKHIVGIETGSLPTFTEQYTGTITSVTAGNGLTGGATSGNATLNVGAGAGISAGNDTIAVDIKDTTKNSKAAVKGGNSDKLYAVELDSNGKLAVSVPWTATTFEGNDELEALLEPFALKTDLDNYKTKQSAISDPSVTNETSTTFISSISQDANGIITATKKKLPTYTNVTESTVSGWGFTKNTGTYSKPTGGIPKTDLASAVQTSLGKADTALQSYTEQYKGTVTGIKMNGSSKGTSGVVDLGTVITGSDIYVLTCTDSQFSSGWTSNATEYNAISNAKIVLLDRSSDRFCSTNIYKGEDKIILDFYNIVSIPDKGFTLTIHKSGYAVTRTRKYNIYPTALSWNDGDTLGPTGTMTLNGADDIVFPQIPSASSTTSGVITTAEQTFAGNKTFNGIVTGTQGFFDTSDARLKNFGEDLKIDFDILCKIPKKYFTWKDDHNNKLQIGTSAQEIQKFYPELVNDENGVLSVAYDKLSVIALSAIDELYKKNQELEMRLCKIEEKLKYGE